MSRQGVLKELPSRPALLAACAQDRPYPPVPLSAHQRAAALCDATVDHGGANTLLGGIIGRRHGWVEQEAEDRLPMLDKPSGQRSGLGAFAAGAHLSQMQHAVPDPQHDSVKPIRGNLLTQMPEVKQSFELNEQTLPKALIGFGRQRCKELDVPNQVGQVRLRRTEGRWRI